MRAADAAEAERQKRMRERSLFDDRAANLADDGTPMFPTKLGGERP